MKVAPRNYALLGVLGGLLLGQYVLSDRHEEARVAGPLFPALIQREPTRIVVEKENAEGRTDRIEVVKTPAGWVLPEQYGFPARERQVEKVLGVLASVTDVDLLATEEESHALYGVDAAGLRLAVFDANERALVDLVQGQPATAGPGGAGLATYVRSLLEEEPDSVFRAPRLEPVPTEVNTWLDTRWIQIVPPAITRIVVRTADDSDFTLERTGDSGIWQSSAGSEVPKRAVQALLDTCANLFFDEVLGVLPSEPAPAWTDPFAAPVLELEFFEGDERRALLAFGAEVEGGRTASRGPGWFVRFRNETYELVRDAVRVFE